MNRQHILDRYLAGATPETLAHAHGVTVDAMRSELDAAIDHVLDSDSLDSDSAIERVDYVERVASRIREDLAQIKRRSTELRAEQARLQEIERKTTRLIPSVDLSRSEVGKVGLKTHAVEGFSRFSQRS